MKSPHVLGGYYDRLDVWNAVARPFGYGGGRHALTVHRRLADPRAGGRATPTRIHDLVLAALPPMDAPRVLDAGCGLGGTMLEFAARVGGDYVGLTLSETQAAVARRAAARFGVEAQVQVMVRSYDAPPAGPFDLVIAIESLAHSRDPALSLAALVRVLAPGGSAVVVDDMPDESARPDSNGSSSAPDDANDLATFKAGWHCPVLWSAAKYRTAFETLGAPVVVDRDLSDDCRPRSLRAIERLQLVNRLAWRLLPMASWRSLLDSHHAGLALERLYRQGMMRYRMLVARRPSAENP